MTRVSYSGSRLSFSYLVTAVLPLISDRPIALASSSWVTLASRRSSFNLWPKVVGVFKGYCPPGIDYSIGEEEEAKKFLCGLSGRLNQVKNILKKSD